MNKLLQEAEHFLKLANDFEIAIFESNVDKLEKALKEIRLAVSCTDSPRIDLLCQTNILPKIAQFLKKEHFNYTNVQNEATWIIANVVSSDAKFTKYVVEELDGINCMLTLLDSPSSNVKATVHLPWKRLLILMSTISPIQAVWAIGNITGEHSAPYSEKFLRNGLLSKLIDIVEDESLDFSIVKTTVWVFSNLAKAATEFELVLFHTPSPQHLSSMIFLDCSCYSCFGESHCFK